jgi:hypothetical protein
MGTVYVAYNKVSAPPADPYLSYVTVHYPFTTDGTNARGIVSPVTTATPISFYNGAAVNSTHTLNGYNTLRLNQSTQAYADIITKSTGNGTEDSNRGKLFDITQTAQWTIECYAYFDSLNGSDADSNLFGDYANVGISPFTPYGTTIFVRSPSSGAGNLGFYDPQVGALFATGGAITTGQWYHLSCERNGATLRGYMNGSKVFESTTWANGNSSAGTSLIGTDDAFDPSGFTVGALVGPGSAYRSGSSPLFTGSIAGIRITKGVNRYGCPNTSFTPDTFPFSTV